MTMLQQKGFEDHKACSYLLQDLVGFFVGFLAGRHLDVHSGFPCGIHTKNEGIML